MARVIDGVNAAVAAGFSPIKINTVVSEETSQQELLDLAPETLSLIRQNQIAKGDVLTVARIAGMHAAKRTAELIPLCHTFALDHVEVECTLDASGVSIETSATCVGRAGVSGSTIYVNLRGSVAGATSDTKLVAPLFEHAHAMLCGGSRFWASRRRALPGAVALSTPIPRRLQAAAGFPFRSLTLRLGGLSCGCCLFCRCCGHSGENLLR